MIKKIGLAISTLLVILIVSTGCGSSDLDVSISLPSGTYYGNQHVTLSCPDSSAQITYSLDGSDPYKSNLVYNPETGINISYTSDLKATAGGNVAQAHYDIIPFTDAKDPTQADFYNRAQGTYSTDSNATDNFILKNSTVTFQQPGMPDVVSHYALVDVNGNNATLIYTDHTGLNQKVALVLDPANNSISINGKVYTKTKFLRDEADRKALEDLEDLYEEEDSYY